MSFSIYTSIRILLDPNSSIDYSSIVHISIPVIGGHTFWHGGRIVFFFSCETGNRRYSYHGNAHQAVGIPVVDSGHILSGHIVGSYRVRVRHLTSHILAHRQFRCGNMTQAPILKLANRKMTVSSTVIFRFASFNIGAWPWVSDIPQSRKPNRANPVEQTARDRTKPTGCTRCGMPSFIHIS